jgi:hypothetical protein
MVRNGVAMAGVGEMAPGLKEHVQEVFMVFMQLFVTFSTEEAYFPLDLGIIAHRGETTIFVLHVKRGDGNAFGDFVKIRIIAAIGAGNSHLPFSC